MFFDEFIVIIVVFASFFVRCLIKFVSVIVWLLFCCIKYGCFIVFLCGFLICYLKNLLMYTTYRDVAFRASVVNRFFFSFLFCVLYVILFYCSGVL